ncbi:MAG: glycosyl transferase [Candidatus Cloacimonetes bacterium]|nr:glycosyl transferase [Candidatus Cloacimonadota bacterium]
MNQKIQKKIHYCWFGRKPLNKLSLKCIDSWKKYCPDYEIIEWNEENFDVNMIPFTHDAYNAKKYAFVSDFARFFILQKEGGIYLDVDVEIIKPLDSLLENKAYMGFETDIYVNPGLGFGAIANHPLMNLFIAEYTRLVFPMDAKKQNSLTVVHIVTNILLKKGLKLNNEKQIIENCTIYSKDFFQPIDCLTKKLIITDNTFSIHHYAASWYTPQRKLLKYLSKLLGPKMSIWVKNHFLGKKNS